MTMVSNELAEEALQVQQCLDDIIKHTEDIMEEYTDISKAKWCCTRNFTWPATKAEKWDINLICYNSDAKKDLEDEEDNITEKLQSVIANMPKELRTRINFQLDPGRKHVRENANRILGNDERYIDYYVRNHFDDNRVYIGIYINYDIVDAVTLRPIKAN